MTWTYISFGHLFPGVLYDGVSNQTSLKDSFAADPAANSRNQSPLCEEQSGAGLPAQGVATTGAGSVASVATTERHDWSLATLGRQKLCEGNLAEAMYFFQRELHEAKQSGNSATVAEAATELAFVCMEAGANKRAGRLYQKALEAWREVRPQTAIKSPRIVSAFALFLHDYTGYLAARGNFVLALRADRRLENLVARFSAFTIYSAMSKRLEERGQIAKARTFREKALAKPRPRTESPYTQKLQELHFGQDNLVFFPQADSDLV